MSADYPTKRTGHLVAMFVPPDELDQNPERLLALAAELADGAPAVVLPSVFDDQGRRLYDIDAYEITDPGGPVTLRCPWCVTDGEPSTMRADGGGLRTAMGWSPHYDEAGVYHSHDPNGAGWVTLSCSRGHTWRYNEGCCPSCDFGKADPELTAVACPGSGTALSLRVIEGGAEQLPCEYCGDTHGISYGLPDEHGTRPMAHPHHRVNVRPLGLTAEVVR